MWAALGLDDLQPPSSHCPESPESPLWGEGLPQESPLLKPKQIWGVGGGLGDGSIPVQ